MGPSSLEGVQGIVILKISCLKAAIVIRKSCSKAAIAASRNCLNTAIAFLWVLVLTSCQTEVVRKSVKSPPPPKEIQRMVEVVPWQEDSPASVVSEMVSQKKKIQKKVYRNPVKRQLPRRQPLLEDDHGFRGRRPLVDPFRVGEKVTLRLSYFGIPAGYLTMEVRPFVQVNGRKSYQFFMGLKSSAAFALFYALDDWAVTHLDYETLVPSDFQLNVNESKQVVLAKSYHDLVKKQATYWERKTTSDKGAVEKRKVWSIEPYSQNVFSAAFYMRVFRYGEGKELAFSVADKGENVVFRGKVLRREKLATKMGVLNTIVVRPQIDVKGVFRPVGDILFWLTDDDRKFLVKIKSKIKIGSIVGELSEWQK